MKEADNEFRILILEDVATDTELVERELRNGGIRFVSKGLMTKEGFVKGLDHLGPDLILADLTLPAFDGMAALAIAQEKYPHIPFIFVSGTMGAELAAQIQKRVATDCVFKDQLSSLVPALNRALRPFLKNGDISQYS